MQRPPRLLGRLLRTLTALAIVAAAANVGAGATAGPADELRLWRGQSKSTRGATDFFVHGAQAGEQIFYTVTAEATPEAARLAAANPSPSIVADLEGNACLPLSHELAQGGDERPFYVFAFVLRRDRAGDGVATRLVASNFALLHDVPSLYMIVEVADSIARVVHFDPVRDSLDEPLHVRVDVDASLVSMGATAIVERAGGLQTLDGLDSTDFGALEEPIDLVMTPDQSALVALTRELVPGGRELLRIRVIDATSLTRELGLIDVLRVNSRLANAQLVTGDDSHRVLVTEEGVIREVMLGADLTRGVTFLPLVPDGSDELLDVRVVDDLLVAVTRSRQAPESRLIVVDLRTRVDPIEWKLPARAERDGLEVTTSQGRITAFVVVEGGAIEVIPLDPDGTRATLGLAGAKKIARSPQAGRLYVLSLDVATRRAGVDLLDADALTLTPVPLPPLSDQIWKFGLFGAPERHWLYFIEQQFRSRVNGVRTEHRLWSCEIDPESGLLRDLDLVAPHPLGGSVRRIAGR